MTNDQLGNLANWAIGLNCPDQYLRAVLNQEGVPAVEHRDGTSEFVITQSNSQLILSTGTLQLEEIESERVMVKFIVPDESTIFRNTGVIDISAPCLVPKSANVGKTDKGRPVIGHNRNGGGNNWIILPLKLATLLKHRGTRVKQFPSPEGRFPYETVAVADRGGIRRLLAGCLRSLCFSRNLPYVHLAYVPNDARSVFGFRVDTDFSSSAEIAEAVRIAEKFGMAWTWFVSTAHINNNLKGLVKLLSGQDVQLHGHRHVIYSGFDRNYRNFFQGLKVLQNAGIRPVGAAAPYGEWNQALNDVFVELGFEYSSEFAYSWDDIPSRPIVNGKENQVLQIPVHPISLGRLAWAGMDQEQMIRYYKRVVDWQVARGEPCFLYDHPGMIVRYPEVVSEVIKYGLERCGTWITMSDYCRWWQKREQVRFGCFINEQILKLAVENETSEICLIVEHQQGIARVQLSPKRHRLELLPWQPVQALPFDPKELQTRKWNLRFFIQELERQIRRRLQMRKEMHREWANDE